MVVLLRNSFVAVAAACMALSSCGPNGASDRDNAGATSQAAAAGSGTKPQNVGDCVETTITLLGPRLEGAPESGSSVQYENGMTQVEYDVLPGVANSRVGDEVRVCLLSVPENCPPGDDRGRMYSGTNLRTGESWSAPDSQHMCGGA